MKYFKMTTFMLEEIDWSTREIKVSATHFNTSEDTCDADLRVRVSRHGESPGDAD